MKRYIKSSFGGFPSRGQVESWKARYPAGTRIKIEYISDNSYPDAIGKIATVEFVDDAGQLHCTYGGGRHVTVCPFYDDEFVIASTQYSKHKIYSAEEQEEQDKQEDPNYDPTFNSADDIKLSGDVKKDFNMLIKYLRDQSYEELGDALDDIVDDPKLYKLLSDGFGSGNLAKVRMSSSAEGIPVTRLLPSQSEIGLDNSLKFPLSQDCTAYFSDGPITIVAPIVTYRKQFVIDGHHRWSQLYMINPKAQISSINFDYEDVSPFRALRNFQGAVAVAQKDVPKQYSKVHNVYDMSEAKIRKYVELNISDACWKSLVKLGVAKDKKSAINYITENAMTLKTDNVPLASAPDREYMPQTDAKTVKVAEQGQTNI